jgi:hypothetical protein
MILEDRVALEAMAICSGRIGRKLDLPIGSNMLDSAGEKERKRAEASIAPIEKTIQFPCVGKPAKV